MSSRARISTTGEDKLLLTRVNLQLGAELYPAGSWPVGSMSMGSMGQLSGDLCTITSRRDPRVPDRPAALRFRPNPLERSGHQSRHRALARHCWNKWKCGRSGGDRQESLSGGSIPSTSYPGLRRMQTAQDRLWPCGHFTAVRACGMAFLRAVDVAVRR